MARSVKITVLVEGGAHPHLIGSKPDSRTRPLVGLSLYVEVDDGTKPHSKTHKILMDVGTTWKRLKHNADWLGVDLDRIDCGFITHWHFDHTGTLPSLLKSMKTRPPFYVPVREPAFTPINAFIELRLPRSFNRVEITGPREILPGVFTTGCLEGYFPLQRGPIHEQALYIPVEGKGLVMLVGCSHPMPQDLIRRAMEESGETKVALLLGGLHFINPTTELQKGEIIEELQTFEIDRVGACHCTGLAGVKQLAGEFGERFVNVELGGVVEVTA